MDYCKSPPKFVFLGACRMDSGNTHFRVMPKSRKHGFPGGSGMEFWSMRFSTFYRIGMGGLSTIKYEASQFHCVINADDTGCDSKQEDDENHELVLDMAFK